MRCCGVGVAEKYIAMVGKLLFRGLICRDCGLLLREKPHSLIIAGGTIPWVLPVKHICASADGIESYSNGVNQKAVLCGALYTAHNFLVQEVFTYQPARAGQGRHHDINLADARIAMVRVAGERSVRVPGQPVLRARSEEHTSELQSLRHL